MAVGDPVEMARVIRDFHEHPEVGRDVRQSVEWTADVLSDADTSINRQG